MFPRLVANVPFTVFDCVSLCRFSERVKKNRKTERNQSANKLRVLSQSWVAVVVREGGGEQT